MHLENILEPFLKTACLLKIQRLLSSGTAPAPHFFSFIGLEKAVVLLKQS
jgi:hypothetical protein